MSVVVTFAVEGAGVVDPSTDRTVDAGTVIFAEATPDAGNKVDRWTNVVSNPNSNKVAIIADIDKEVKVSFCDSNVLTTLELEVCNRALGLIHATYIESSNPLDPNYLDCQQYLSRAIEAVLSANNWDWATVRSSLSLELPVPLSTYEHAFLLPSDFIGLRDKNVVSGSLSGVDTRFFDIYPSQAYSIEKCEYGLCILVNSVNVDDDGNNFIEIRYISNVGLHCFPDSAIAAVEYSLAWHLATKTTDKDRNSGLIEMLNQLTQMKIANSKSISSRRTPVRNQQSPIIGSLS